MADEYIRRDAAMKAVASQYGACRSPAQNRMIDEIRNKIRRMPAADAAEVVRCKDCIYRINGRCFSRTSFSNAPAVEPDNFCSWGATE